MSAESYAVVIDEPYVQGRVHYILGTEGPDSIQVSDDGSQWKIQTSYNDGANDNEQWIDKSDVDFIRVKVCSGGDQVQLGSANIPSIIYGDTGDDQIQGGDGNDQIEGKNGNDTLYGGDGNDDVQGGNGTDSETEQGPNDEGNSNCSFNIAPVASDSSHNVDEDNAITIVLPAVDANNDVLTYQINSQLQFGTLTGSGESRIYQANANYHGNDAFTFSVNDGLVDSNLAAVRHGIS